MVIFNSDVSLPEGNHHIITINHHIITILSPYYHYCLPPAFRSRLSFPAQVVDADRQIEALEDQRAAAMLGDGPDAVDSRVTLPTRMGIYWGYMGNYMYIMYTYLYV
jgi:hypothetical protein